LDSIDALELGLALKKKYNITISPESEDMKKVFTSVRTIVDFIENSATKI
jgi:acyl carrier protein